MFSQRLTRMQTTGAQRGQNKAAVVAAVLANPKKE